MKKPTQNPARVRPRSSRARLASIAGALLLTAVAALPTAVRSANVEHVIHISVDGVRSDAILSSKLETFMRLRREGTCTSNARIDFLSSQTLPSHMCQFTGLDVAKHGVLKDKKEVEQLPWFENIFDLVHDVGGKTCMFAAKSKFESFDRTFSIDEFYFSRWDSDVMREFKDEMMGGSPCKYAFLHLRAPDGKFHKNRGVTDSYHEAIRETDDRLGELLEMIEGDPRFAMKTAVIVTTDHGVAGTNHADYKRYEIYKIPFCVWGPGVEPDTELYDLNLETRKDPGTGRPDNNEVPQPIRCHDAAPLAANLLGIKPSPNGGFASRGVLNISPHSGPGPQSPKTTTTTTTLRQTTTTTTAAPPPPTTTTTTTMETPKGGPPPENVDPTTQRPPQNNDSCKKGRMGDDCARNKDCCNSCKKWELRNGRKVKYGKCR